MEARLEKWRDMLAGKDEAKRAEAEAGPAGGDRPASRAGGLGRLRHGSAGRQAVFNLEVAEGHDFFVGRQGALVHDNSLVQPTPEPFDAAPELAAVAPSASPR